MTLMILNGHISKLKLKTAEAAVEQQAESFHRPRKEFLRGG